MVRKVTTLMEFNEVVQQAGNKLVVVDFTATWCPPCQRIAPKFEKLSQENTDVIFIKVDVNEGVEVSQHFKIRSVPTFYFYKNGNLVHEFKGADEKQLQLKVAELK
ncbi:thioredoxin-like [Pholidichthys leucotaenia]